MSNYKRLRELIDAPEILAMPGIFDGSSSRPTQLPGFAAGLLSGEGIGEASLGWADQGIMGLEGNLLVGIVICPQLLTAGAIPGMNNAIAALNVSLLTGEVVGRPDLIEDQISPKRCGHMRGKELIGAREAAKKIEAAVKAKRDAGFIINARTDAIAVEGIDGAIERAKMYIAAGADMVYPDAIASDEQIKRFVDGVQAPVSLNMGFGIRSRPTTPQVSIRRLQEIGVARIGYARMLPAAAIMGMTRALKVFRDSMETGTVYDRPDMLVGIEDITDLIGCPAIDRLEEEFLLPEEMERKYGTGPRSFVVRGKETEHGA